jgi:hypothetical protein
MDSRIHLSQRHYKSNEHLKVVIPVKMEGSFERKIDEKNSYHKTYCKINFSIK